MSLSETAEATTARKFSGKQFWFGVTGAALALSVAALWTAFRLHTDTAIGFPLWQLVAIIEILFFAGLMSGLSGFGFSAIGSSCLLFIQPRLAVPLLMALSTANQFMSISQLRKDMPKTWKEAWPSGTAPYVVGGVLGVPLGIWLLNHLPAAKLMFAFGLFLVIYSVFSLFKPSNLKMNSSFGASSGMVVGFIGGTLGGFTAFPGAAVVVWTGLQDLSKQLTRSIVQPFILVLQVMSLATTAYAYPAVFGREFWILLAVTVPIVLPGTLGGVFLYRRISDINFRRVSFALLGISGSGLLLKILFK